MLIREPITNCTKKTPQPSIQRLGRPLEDVMKFSRRRRQGRGARGYRGDIVIYYYIHNKLDGRGA